MTRSSDLEYFILYFYCGSMIVCLGVVYEYESILVILIDVIVLINIFLLNIINGLTAMRRRCGVDVAMPTL
jgi:hypothetical protein